MSELIKNDLAMKSGDVVPPSKLVQELHSLNIEQLYARISKIERLLLEKGIIKWEKIGESS